MRISAVYLLLLSALLLGSCGADEPGTDQKNEFFKYYGEAFTNEIVDATQLDGANYLLCNFERDTSYHLALIKTDEYGNRIWQKVLLEQRNSLAGGVAINNGSLAIVGSLEKEENSGTFNLVFVSVSIDGDVLESNELVSDYNDIAKGLSQKNDGGFIIIGTRAQVDNLSNTDRLFTAVSETGELELESTRGGTGAEEVYSIRPYAHGFIVAGSTKSFPSQFAEGIPEIYFLSTIGAPEANYTFNFEGAFIDVASLGGKIYACGEQIVETKRNIVFCELSEDYLELNFKKEYSSALDHRCGKMLIASDESFILASSLKEDIGVSFNMMALHFDREGNMLDERVIGGVSEDFAELILAGNYPNFILCGTTKLEDTQMIAILKTAFE